MSYFLQAMVFLVQTLFGLYLLALLLRFLMQLSRSDFHNPIARILAQITNPPLRPLRRIIPGYSGIDWALVLLIVAVQVAEIAVIGLLTNTGVPQFPGLLVLALGRILQLVIYIYIFVILIAVVLSWVNPHAYNAATVLIYSLSEPVLRPARNMLPEMGGLDLSPLVVLIVLNLLQILLVAPILDSAAGMIGQPVP